MEIVQHVMMQEAESERDGGESEVADQATGRLQHAGVAQPHLVPRPAARYEADVPQQGGRRRSPARYQGRKIRS